MRAKGYENLSESDDDGGVEGYAIDATAPNLAHWLDEQLDASLVDPVLRALRETPDGPTGRVAVLKSLWVNEEAQGRGLGRWWLDGFVERAAAGTVLLVADAQQGQREGFVLQRFYEDQGFAVVTATGAGPLMAWPEEQAERLRERLELHLAATDPGNAAPILRTAPGLR